jgi:EAL domain-containing protein (putative c-di-GMP-specific phosphodiesterase class I)
MGAKVVCEGIETVEELKAVLDSGAHYGQGYSLARPAFPLPTYDWAALTRPMFAKR